MLFFVILKKLFQSLLFNQWTTKLFQIGGANFTKDFQFVRFKLLLICLINDCHKLKLSLAVKKL